MKRLAVFAFVFFFSTAAFADDTKQNMFEDMHAYYAGERASAYIIMAVGGASVAAGSVLVAQNSDFDRGLGVPLIALGALEGLGAIFYAVQVTGEIRHYATSLDRDSAAYRREEIAHMHGTTSRFIFYRLTELGLALSGVGIATYGFVANSDAWKGAGIGVASIALPFLIIDTINNGRAARYTGHVREFAPQENNAVSPLARAQAPLYLSWSGRF